MTAPQEERRLSWATIDTLRAAGLHELADIGEKYLTARTWRTFWRKPKRPAPVEGGAMSDTVWIEAVPLPFYGWRYDQCGCGAKFKGRNRNEQYELHYRREHLPSDGSVMVGVSREKAERIAGALREES